MKHPNLARLWHSARHYTAAQVSRRVVSRLRGGVLRGARRLLPALDRRYRLDPAPKVEYHAERVRIATTRTYVIERDAQPLAAELLGAKVSLAPPVDWQGQREPLAGSHLRRFHLHYMDYVAELDDADFVALVLDWIARNRPHCGRSDAFASYCISIRVVTWLEQLRVRALRLDAQHVAAIEASIAEQTEYLYRHLERDIGGNHLLRNLHALLWVASRMPGSRPDAWRQRAEAVLEVELQRQFLADGMHFERSPFYHLQVYVDLLEISHLPIARPLQAQLAQTLDRVRIAAEWLLGPDGRVLRFSDGLFDDRSNDTVNSLITAGALSPGERTGAHILPDAAFAAWRSPRHSLFYDFGAIAPAHLPGHAHADTFNFAWYCDDKPMVVDPGVYEYESTERRQWSRSTAAHNCVAIEQADQADVYGSFRVGRRNRVDVDKIEATESLLHVTATHDGYRSRHGIAHRRILEVDRNRVRIEDVLRGRVRQEATGSLLLHPDCTVEKQSATGFVLTHGAARAQLSSELPLEVRADRYFPALYVEQKTLRLCYDFPGELNRNELIFTPLKLP